MSSGALLLKQLQARQRPQAGQVRVDQRRSNCDTSREEASIDDTYTTSSAGSRIRSTVDKDKDKEVLDSQQADERVDNGNGAVTIEVCLGPDCSGGGGGAALLEIESLVTSGGEQGTGSICNIHVVGGGCRDYCTMGPNVYIHSDYFATEDSHFTKVNCPAECRWVVQAASGERGKCDANIGKGGNNDDIGKILQLRADGRRWRVLREQAAKERRLRVRERENKDVG